MNKSFKLSLSALFIVINMVLASIAFSLKLPIYLDTLGTALGVRLLGLKYGVAIAVSSALVNGFYDVYALYYMPVGILLALFMEVILNKRFSGLNTFIKTAIVSIPVSIVGAMITAYVFGGITSSGSSILVTMMSRTGMSMVMSAFIVQIGTDYLDRFIILNLRDFIVKMIPNRIMEKFRRI